MKTISISAEDIKTFLKAYIESNLEIVITDDTATLKSLSIDSLDLHCLIVEFEDHYNTSVDYSLLELDKTFEEFCVFLTRFL